MCKEAFARRPDAISVPHCVEPTEPFDDRGVVTGDTSRGSHAVTVIQSSVGHCLVQ